jgi:hypothetical protein
MAYNKPIKRVLGKTLQITGAIIKAPFKLARWILKKPIRIVMAGIVIWFGANKLSNSEQHSSSSSYKPRETLVAKAQGQSAYGKQKQNGEPAWDHPDKTRAEYYQEGRLTTSQLYEDTLIDQDLSPTPLKLSPITKIRQELSRAVSNGANYDKVADAELYIQDKADPDNVIAFGIGVMPNGFNKERATALMTTMPSRLNGESRSMARTRFNLQLGGLYCFGIEVQAGEESDQIRITYPFKECSTFKTEQHNGRIVVFSNDDAQAEKASEGQTDENIKHLETMSFNKSPDEIVWMNGDKGPLLNRITPEKNSVQSNTPKSKQPNKMAVKRALNGR